jgi:hypothetical protein
MRGAHVDPKSRLWIDPAGARPTAGEDQRMGVAAFQYGEFEVLIEWRFGDGLPVFHRSRFRLIERLERVRYFFAAGGALIEVKALPESQMPAGKRSRDGHGQPHGVIATFSTPSR